MSLRNESSIPGGHAVNSQNETKPPPLRPEEIKMFKDCANSLYLKAGIPFAIFCQFLSAWRMKQEKVELTPQLFFKRGFIFIGNVMLGTFLWAPTCYYKLAAMRAEYLKKNAELIEQNIPQLEAPPPVPQTEDLNYSSLLDLSEPQDTYSLDFSSSQLLSDDVEIKKLPSTTYEDLRSRHRSGYGGNKGSLLNLPPEKPRLGNSASIENPVLGASSPPPPQKIVKKNKYGDEME